MFDFKLGIFGVGNWGKNHLKTAAQLFEHKNIFVYDPGRNTPDVVHAVSKDINIVNNVSDILNNPEISAVIIATPASTHYYIAKEALLAGKHCLVEKPITLYSSEAKELADIAEKKNLRLMVGHVLLYHGAIIRIKEEIGENKMLGDIQYIYSNRLNLGKVRTEENSLWSFAPHDISIIQYLIGENPISVSASGASVLQEHIEDSTITVMKYPGNISAHIFVSWLHPFKEHRLVVIGTNGMFVFEDSAPENKLIFYKKGFRKVGDKLEPFNEASEIITYENHPPLMEEQKHFFDCILKGTRPLSDGIHAVEVLHILESAQKGLGK